MRRALIAMAVSVSMLMPVSAGAIDPKHMVPSPLGIALTLGQWLMKDRTEAYYVRVKSSGDTEQQARENGFRLATNLAVGSLVLSETRVTDGEVAAHDIINYSSGFIHDFRILSTSTSNGSVTVEMDVWVSKSLIADRVLNVSRDRAQVEGGRISAQIQSWQQERATGDRVLETVLADYPRRAFDISVGQTRVVANEQRKTFLVVPVNLSWNQTYVASLTEALRTVNHRPDCGGWFSACQSPYVVKAPGVTAHFMDDRVYWIFDRHVYRSNPQVMMTILDQSGRPQYRDCFAVPEIGQEYSPWKFIEMGPMIQIQDWRNKRHSLWVELGSLPVANLDRIEVTVVRVDQCPGYRPTR
jgi:hypothetical protein